MTYSPRTTLQPKTQAVSETQFTDKLQAKQYKLTFKSRASYT
jgi:hypothetical protein